MKNFSLIDKFVHRTPLLSWLEIKNLMQIENISELCTTLENILIRREVREALYVASIDLYMSIYHSDKSIVSSLSESPKLLRAVLKYIIRMGTRCTPYGFFAGVGIGKWGKSTKLQFDLSRDVRRHLQIDYAYIYHAIQNIINETPGIHDFLTFRPNNTIQEVGERYRFITYIPKGDNLKLEISSTEITDYLQNVLTIAHSGTSLDELVGALSEYDVEPEEAKEYVNQLIDRQLLVSNLEPSLSDGNLLLALIRDLRNLLDTNFDPRIDNIFKDCVALHNRLEAIGNEIPENPHTYYKELIFKELNFDFSAKYSFQAVQTKKMEVGNISFKVAAKIRRASEVLNKLTFHPEDNGLTIFRDRFIKRYENNEVPLLEVLDTELGISYQASRSISDDTPLIDGLTFDAGNDNLRYKLSWNKAHSILLKKLLQCQKEECDTITINNEDLKDLSANWENVPSTLSYMFKLVRDSQLGEEVLHLESGSFSTALGAFNRFTHISQEFADFGNEIIRTEEQLENGYIVVELVHVPDYMRIGNVLQRGVTRSYELPYLTQGRTVNSSTQIHMSDLLISVRNNRLVLKSKKHNTYVKVLLSQAHNYRLRTHPVYHFIGDMQYQNTNWPVMLDWGPLERIYKFMPRVVYEDTILRSATWSFDEEDVTEIINLVDSNSTRAIKKLQEKWRIPDWVQLVQADNKLLLNLKSDSSRKVLQKEIKKSKNLVLQEFLEPSSSASPTDEKGGIYCNEFIAFFKRSNPIDNIRPLDLNKNAFAVNLARNFYPGDEWLYLKIYCGTKNSDKILSTAIQTIVTELMQKGIIDKWFYIKYADPDFHLRVRFHLKDKKNTGIVMEHVNTATKTLVTDKAIHDFQYATYNREIERYGSATIELSETYFSYDSNFALLMINYISSSNEPEVIRYKVLFLITDAIFTEFGVPPLNRIQILERMDGTRRYNMSKQLKRQYKDFKPQLTDLFAVGNTDTTLSFSKSIIEQRIKQLTPIAEQIKSNIEVDIDAYISSIIHMSINRLCLTRANEQEYVVYNYLKRHYNSQANKVKIK